MYRKQVRRRRAVLVLLVVSCLVLISTHFSEGGDGPLHSAQNGIGAALGPLEEGASRALKPVRDLVNWFDETFQARGENEQLEAEVGDLRTQLAETEDQLKKGIEQGKVAKVAAASELASFDRVEARVAVRSSTVWDQTLKIDQGSSSGISEDDAVITGNGLIGRVSSVTGGSARVALITNRDSAVTARVLRNGPTGLLTPELGAPSGLLFGLIDSEEKLSNGKTLVTAAFSESDLSSRLPAGIPIGEIQEEGIAEQERTQEVHVEPFADLSKLDYVTVLAGGGS